MVVSPPGFFMLENLRPWQHSRPHSRDGDFWAPQAGFFFPNQNELRELFAGFS